MTQTSKNKFRQYITDYPKRFAFLEAIIAMLIWSSTSVLAKMAIQYYEPFTVAAVRFSTGGILLLPFVFHYWKKNGTLSIDRQKIPGKFWVFLFGMGFFLYVLGNGMGYLAMKTVPANVFGLMDGLTPVLVIPLSMLFLNEKPQQQQVFGIGIILLGFFLFFKDVSLIPSILVVVFLGLAWIGNAGNMILARLVARGKILPPVTVSSFSMLAGGFVLTGIAFFEGMPTFSLPGFLILMWLSVVNSALAFMLLNHAFVNLQSYEVAAILAPIPLLTAILSNWMLGEQLILIQYLALSIVVFGIIFMQYKPVKGKTGYESKVISKL
ncbi:MAG: EamA family transporter [Anaerolineaceae bacterium]|nr:EamA family transporter [Anaerolineaceae bacterium]